MSTINPEKNSLMTGFAPRDTPNVATPAPAIMPARLTPNLDRMYVTTTNVMMIFPNRCVSGNRDVLISVLNLSALLRRYDTNALYTSHATIAQVNMYTKLMTISIVANSL